MKKNIVFLMITTAIILASCKNEDITISREVEFVINPYTVVRDFAKHEYQPGDMSTVYWYNIGDRLRVQLFVYDTRGKLVDTYTKYVDDYETRVYMDMELLDGSYTVVVTTDEVGLSGNTVSDNYWDFTGTEYLSELKIAENPEWLNGPYKKLGITRINLVVGAGHDFVEIDVNPAGAMIHSWIYNIHGFVDVEEYSLWMNRKKGKFSFDAGSPYMVSSEQVNYTGYLRADTPSDYTASNVYGYNFIAPFGNTGFRWEVYLEDGTYGTLLQEEYTNVQAGKCYGCYLTINGLNTSFTFVDLDNGKSYDMSSVNGYEQINTKEKAHYSNTTPKRNIEKHLEGSSF